MRILEYFWYRLRPGHLILYPLSLVFGLVAAARRALYRSGRLQRFRLPVPVIVVGNISVGGTGKTPLVIWLAQWLGTQGWHPGIIIRGYGGSQRVQRVMAQSDPATVGDEPVLLAQRCACPVWVGADRVAAARELLRQHPECDVVLSDDGLQHYRLQRDIEIAVVEGARRFGNGLLLPAGPLREPVRRLRSVDAVVMNGAGEIAGLATPQFSMQLSGTQFVNLRDPQRVTNAQDLRSNALHAIAGIGHPQRFFARLEQLGLRFTAHPFPDHHPFSAQDLAFANKAMLLMTQKDAVKCAAFAPDDWWYLAVEAQPDAALGDLILQRLTRLHGRQTA